MLEIQDNKMMHQDDVTVKAVSPILYDFFFPGSGVWKPKTIRAESREVAEQVWKEQREPVEPKAEEQTNNE